MASTLAGSGATGRADGMGTSASIAFPLAVAMIPNTGVVVVIDRDNNTIRLVSPLNNVTTLASSVQGFRFPTCQAVLPPGSGFGNDPLTWLVVVSDGSNNHPRLVTYPGAVVTTLAGSGSQGSADGLGTAASFYGLDGLAVLALYKIVVADNVNHRLRVVNPSGLVSTLAGSVPGVADGTGTSARFNSPIGVALLPSTGVIAVAEGGNNRIRLVTPAGVVTTLAGMNQGYADGVGTSARFSSPAHLLILASNIHSGRAGR